MKEIFKYIILVAVAAVMWSCDDDLGIVDKGDTITFTIDASATFSDTDSRAVFADGDEKNITKYCLLVYDGTINSSKLIESVDITSLPTTLTLPSPGAGNYRAIMIANSQLSELKTYATKGSSTLDDLNNATFPVSSHYNIPGGGSDPDGYAPAGAAINFTWSGYVDYTGSTRSMFFNLNPNMARLTVTVVNKTKSNTAPKDKIKIVNLQIKNVRNRVLYAQNALSDMGDGYFVEQSEGDMGVLDYNIEKLELAPDESKTRHYYIPHNMVDAGGKVRPNAPTKATYIEVDGIRNFDFMDIAYKVYLGSAKNGNPTGDYHVQCDHKYTVNITITNDGLDYNISSSVNQASSEKSTEPEKIVLPPQNNCYMIHPKSSNKSGYILYQMPIFERINEFWGHKTWYTGEANEITDDTEWVAEVIWQDIPTQVMGFSDASGTNTLTTTYSGKGKTPVYFKLKRLDQYGNIVVGVKKKGETAYLWSWHLWVTDYCPDVVPVPSACAVEPYNNIHVNGMYVDGDTYLVDNQGYDLLTNTGGKRTVAYGNVQHWHHENTTSYWGNTIRNSTITKQSSKAAWEGMYKDKWIMDRNLGARMPTNRDAYSNPEYGFGLYYQFGRKDPFAYTDKTYTITGADRGKTWNKYNSSEFNGCPATLSNGVRNPNTFYYKNETRWASDAPIGSGHYWYSLNTATRGAKTIFDPCPPGWCLPVSDIFDFALYSHDSNANGTNYDHEVYLNGKTSSYYTSAKSSFTIYIDQGDGKRNAALLTSVGKYKGGYIVLDALFPLQGYIASYDDSTGGTVQAIAAEYVSYRGELASNGYSHPSRGYLWLTETSGNHNAYNYDMRVRLDCDNILDTSRQYTNRDIHRYNGGLTLQSWNQSRGHSVRCIQEPNL